MVPACDHFSLLGFWCIVKIWYHIYIKCKHGFHAWMYNSARRPFGYFAIYIYGAWYSEVVLFCSMWANFVAKCKNERSLWRGFCGGLCREEKTSLCIRCNPKLGIESQLLFWERTLYLYERIIWEYWSLGIVRVS